MGHLGLGPARCVWVREGKGKVKGRVHRAWDPGVPFGLGERRGLENMRIVRVSGWGHRFGHGREKGKETGQDPRVGSPVLLHGRGE